MSGRSLLFDWPGRHHLQVVLPAALVFAVLLHGFGFFLFSVIYPRPQADPIDSVTVFFPLPDTPNAVELRALLAASDPSLVAPGRLPPARVATNTTPYVPSFLRRGVDLVALPPADGVDAAPHAAEPVPVRLAPRRPAPAPRSAATRLFARGILADRVPDLGSAADALRATAAAPLPPAKFLVRVEPDGRVSNIFLSSGSGNEGLDAAAAALLGRLAFRAGPDRAVWDEVEFHWGSDVVRALP